MKEINYWQQFITTGRIEDYLNYRACTKKKDGKTSENSEKEVQGVEPNAGWHLRDRTHIEDSTYRGI